MSRVKPKILELISMGYKTADEIATALGKNKASVGSLLKRYMMDGDLTRVKVGRKYMYSLTEKGRQKLEYFRNKGYL